MNHHNTVHPEQFRDPELEFSGEVIGFYSREFYVFDNFSSFQIEWNGRHWPTSEHAYHSAKFTPEYPDIVEEIAASWSAHDAFKIAHGYEQYVRSDWEDIKVAVMEDICRTKLTQHAYAQSKLHQTGTMYIVEDSPRDDFWGWGPNRDGRNELGKIWMRLREEISGGTTGAQ